MTIIITNVIIMIKENIREKNKKNKNKGFNKLGDRDRN